MKKALSVIALAAAPSLAMAHEGHGGIGLFHHLSDLVPAIALVAVAAFIIWKRTR
ncbi:hypothetical protein [Shewanella maritima]|uniref:hypothetical protein n=1 Tax=Shewanella maritima TaxID=2520507 RepID=UPI003735DF6F